MKDYFKFKLFKIQSYFNELWWGFKYLFIRHDLIRTHLSKTRYFDKDTLMLYGMMSLLVDYVEKENGLVCEWDPQEEKRYLANLEITDIYFWWKYKNNREDFCSFILHIWRFYEEDFKISREFSNFIDELQTKEKRQEQEMLHRLINIRTHLWT